MVSNTIPSRRCSENFPPMHLSNVRSGFTPARTFVEDLLLLAAGLFLCLSWVAPNHETPWVSLQLELLAAISGIGFFLFALIARGTRVGLVPRLFVLLLLIASIPIAQWFAGTIAYHGDAILACIYVSSVAAMIWVGFVTCPQNADRIVFTLAVTFVWAAIISTGIAIYQKLGLSSLGVMVIDIDSDGRALGNVGQANHLATLFVFGFVSLAWLYQKRKIAGWPTVFAAMFVVVGLVLTGSRQPFFGLLAIGACGFRAPSLRHIKMQQWIVLLFLFLWLIFVWSGAGSFFRSIKIETPVDLSRASIGFRPLLWSQFGNAIANAPWWGYGWQGGMTAQATVAVAHPGLEFSQYAHSLPMDLLIWNGIPAGLLLTAALIFWYARAVNQVRTSGGWFQFSIITVVLVHSLLEYPFAFSYILLPIALSIGQLEAKANGFAYRWPQWTLPLIGGIILCVVVRMTSEYFSLAEERRDLIAWKIRLGGDHPLPGKPTTKILDQLAASIEWLRLDPTPGMSNDQVERQAVLSRRYPTVALLSRTALVFGLNGRTDRAYVELVRLRGLHGERYFAMAVAQLRNLAASSQPALRPLIRKIDEGALRLPDLPDYLQELAGHGRR